MPEAANEEIAENELSPAVKRVLKQRQVIAALAGCALSLLLRLLPRPGMPTGPVLLPHPFEVLNHIQALWASRVFQFIAISIFAFLAVYRWRYPGAWLFAFLAGLGCTGAVLNWLMGG